MTRTWSAVLARLGVPTGDGRIIAPGGGSSRDLPLPLMYQHASSDGHGGSVVVGRIETMSFADGMVTATGSMLDAAYGTDVMELLEAGVIGPSVDLDDIEYTMDEQERIVITSWRIAGATLVAIPAFEGVSVTLDPLPVRGSDEEEEDRYPEWRPFSLSAFSVRTSGWADMPMADEGRAWDGNAAADRVFAWAGGEENISWPKYARAFLRKDDDANPETRGAYGFGIADVIDGTLTIVPRGVFAAAAAVQGARTGKSPEDAEGMKRVLRGLYTRMDREAPFSAGPDYEGLFASGGWAMAEFLPPSDWFRQPDLDRLTPITISDTGRVFGHIYEWGTCHVGLPGCVTAPPSQSGYMYFHTGEQPTSDGLLLPVGALVAGPRHADTRDAFQAAQAHYDDPKAAAAKVMAGEDKHGIWVAGWINPHATKEAVDIFRTNPVSGDWRRIGGALEMIAVCSVNSPGFPVPRARVAFSLEQQRTLIASSGIVPVSGEYEPVLADDRGRFNKSVRARWAWAMAQTGMES